MYSIKEGLDIFNAAQFCRIYIDCVNEFREKTGVHNDKEHRKDNIYLLTTLLTYPLNSQEKYILLYKDEEVIGFQIIQLPFGIIDNDQGELGFLYIKPEYRKMITIDDKTTYAVAHIRNYSYASLEKRKIISIHIRTHKTLLKNVLMYIREGFIPYNIDENDYVDMVKEKDKSLPKEDIDNLVKGILNDKTIKLIDIYDQKYGLCFTKRRDRKFHK